MNIWCSTPALMIISEGTCNGAFIFPRAVFKRWTYDGPKTSPHPSLNTWSLRAGAKRVHVQLRPPIGPTDSSIKSTLTSRKRRRSHVFSK